VIAAIGTPIDETRIRRQIQKQTDAPSVLINRIAREAARKRLQSSAMLRYHLSSMEPHELLNAVLDQHSFLVFVKALTPDRLDEVEKGRVSPSSPYGPGANGWENHTIGDFLESATAWAEDSNFGQDQRLSDNPWRRLRSVCVLREDLRIARSHHLSDKPTSGYPLDSADPNI
jgi:hypothetical protein